MAARDKIVEGFRILFDDSGATPRDLTGDLVPGSLKDGGGFKMEKREYHGANAAVKNYIKGKKESVITATFYKSDVATTGAYTVLSGMEGAGGTLTLQWGSNGAAPTTGDPEWEGEYVYFPQGEGFEDGKAVIYAEFAPQHGQSDPAAGTVA